MLDYANEAGLIRKILDGHDPHDATAEMTGLDRDAAKTLNFALLYGMGKDTLAETLGVSVKEAKEFKYQYFGRLPQVKKFLRAVTTAAERRGFITDWAGRRLYFPDPRFAYKAPNALIQGGCSSIHKKAMVATDKVLAPWKSDILFQVHDEIDFDMHPGELELVPRLKEEMEKIYPYKRLPMRCSVEHSWKSFGDLVEGMPDVA